MTPSLALAHTVLAEVVPDKLGGLPGHPLIVHIPVVLAPLAAIGSVLALVRARWRPWLLPTVAVLAGAAVVGVQLAIWSGENLEADGEKSALIERHSQLAEQARPMIVVFFLVAAAAAFLAWRSTPAGGDGHPHGSVAPDRTARLARFVAPVCALAVVTGGLATTWVVRTGHTGAKSVWVESGGDEGKDKPAGDRPAGDRDGDADAEAGGG